MENSQSFKNFGYIYIYIYIDYLMGKDNKIPKGNFDVNDQSDSIDN